MGRNAYSVKCNKDTYTHILRTPYCTYIIYSSLQVNKYSVLTVCLGGVKSGVVALTLSPISVWMCHSAVFHLNPVPNIAHHEVDP